MRSKHLPQTLLQTSWLWEPSSKDHAARSIFVDQPTHDLLRSRVYTNMFLLRWMCICFFWTPIDIFIQISFDTRAKLMLKSMYFTLGCEAWASLHQNLLLSVRACVCVRGCVCVWRCSVYVHMCRLPPEKQLQCGAWWFAFKYWGFPHLVVSEVDNPIIIDALDAKRGIHENIGV